MAEARGVDVEGAVFSGLAPANKYNPFLFFGNRDGTALLCVIGGKMEHCMKNKYTKREQLLTCYRCAAPLSDNQLVKMAYQMNATVGWAKNNLRILADMADAREMDWFASEARRIMDGLMVLDT